MCALHKKLCVLPCSIQTANPWNVLNIYLISDFSLFVLSSSVHRCTIKNNVLWMRSQSINSFIEKISCYFNPPSEFHMKKIIINVEILFSLLFIIPCNSSVLKRQICMFPTKHRFHIRFYQIFTTRNNKWKCVKLFMCILNGISQTICRSMSDLSTCVTKLDLLVAVTLEAFWWA